MLFLEGLGILYLLSGELGILGYLILISSISLFIYVIYLASQAR